MMPSSVVTEALARRKNTPSVASGSSGVAETATGVAGASGLGVEVATLAGPGSGVASGATSATGFWQAANDRAQARISHPPA